MQKVISEQKVVRWGQTDRQTDRQHVISHCSFPLFRFHIPSTSYCRVALSYQHLYRRSKITSDTCLLKPRLCTINRTSVWINV